MTKNAEYLPGWKFLPITSLRKAEWNYKENDADTMAKLVANLEKNDQIENVIVRPISDDASLFEVVNGNHRLEALSFLGVPEVFCFDLGPVSQAHAMRVAVETNETRFPVNPVLLSEIVSSLVKDSGVASLLGTMPFSEDQIKGMDLLAKVPGNAKPKSKKAVTLYYVVCEGCGKKHYTDQEGNLADGGLGSDLSSNESLSSEDEIPDDGGHGEVDGE